MTFTLVATAKNEGPYLLEWVAYHRMIGFDHILVFQNDSDDLTGEILTVLKDIGAIDYRYNRAGRGRHQVKAYKRAARQDYYQASDWAMALDLDEFLAIKVGSGRLPDLMAALPEADEILLNWRRFGHGGLVEIPDELVTSAFVMAEAEARPVENLTPYKAMFRPDMFARPGIHRPPGATLPEEDIRTCNGSGLMLPEFERHGFRCKDPGCRRLAQVNHYMVRDAASFVLKSYRGSAHQADRGIDRRYWKKRNFNDARDDGLAARGAEIVAVMAELDRQSGGRLEEMRRQSLALHRDRFQALLQDRVYRNLYNFCVAYRPTPPRPDAEPATLPAGA